MSGIISGIDYSLLFSSSGSSISDASSAILNDIYNGAATQSSSTAVSTGNPLTDLKLAQQNQTKDIAAEAKVPAVSQAIAAFTKAVSGAKTIQAALGNPNVQQVLLTANGLSSYIGQTALVQKLFMSNLSDSKSLANQLGDSSALAAVQTYDFAQNGLAELQNPKIISTLTSAYAEVQWRNSLDQATPGLSNALDFLGQASSIKSANDVLDNVVNFDVITTALGIPQDIVYQSTAAQQAAISSHLDFAKLQDPKYVNSLTDQYLLTMQSNNQSDSSGSTALSLIA